MVPPGQAGRRHGQRGSTVRRGRHAENMKEYWPRAGDDASRPKVLREYGEFRRATPKALVSRTRQRAGFNTPIIGGVDAIGQLAALGAETGVGGASLATQLLRAGLPGELLLFPDPAYPGHGRPLSGNSGRPIGLGLLERRSFEEGVTMYHYAIRTDGEAS